MATVAASSQVHYLSNGLRVVSRELHHASVATVMVWYGVGSRDEIEGRTGISHFLEHMMFKGTVRFPSGVLEEGVNRRGGMWNAFTGNDFTAYYELLPARHIEFALEFEADRMANMTFDAELTRRERGIILSEREGRENSPTSWLMEAFMLEAYQRSPYRHSVIGSKLDIAATTATVLAEHYQEYYHPGNATLVVTGDFNTEQLLELAEKQMGTLPSGSATVRSRVQEPEQTGIRRTVVRRPGPNPHLLAGYKIPPAEHADHAALTMLATVLAGALSFSPRGGGGEMGRSSRLYRNLVNRGIATMASGYPWALQEGGLFVCSGIPVPGVELQRLEEALLGEVEALRQERVAADELARAQKQVRSQYIYSIESVMSQGLILGSTAMTRSTDRLDTALAEFEAVSAADIQRVAREYLSPERLTVGWFLPDTSTVVPASLPASLPNSLESASDSEAIAATPLYQQRGSLTVIVKGSHSQRRILDPDRIVHEPLPGGATLLVYPAESIPSAYLRVQVEAGAVHDPAGQEGLSHLTAQLLTRGSSAFTAAELAQRTDALGMSVRVDIGRETAVGSLKCLPEDTSSGIEIMAEVLRRPVFTADEFGRMQDRFLVGIKESNNDTRSVSGRRLAALLYPGGHPYGSPASGTEQSIAALTAEELSQFHARHYGLQGAVITAVGNLDPQRVKEALLRALDGWGSGTGPLVIPAPSSEVGAFEQLSIAGKSQTDIAFGWALVDRLHPDYMALDLLATLFGGNGTTLTNRLFRDVREKHGFSYYQSVSFDAARGAGAWSGHIGVGTANVEVALAVVKAQLSRLAQERIAEDELGMVKQFFQDFPAVQHEAPERIAARLAELHRFGLGLDYLNRYTDLVGQVTAEELQAAAAHHLVLDRLSVVTAGPPPDGSV